MSFMLAFTRILCNLSIFFCQGIKAREILHAHMEKIIEEKKERQHTDEEYNDAFDYMLSSAKENDQQLSMQELKVPELTSTVQGRMCQPHFLKVTIGQDNTEMQMCRVFL